ncbi:MAG TPA: ASCH domain-containing protein [Gemmatimonadales bacterium]|nr:ASCH domain-containing protein [Gemmatimonadales bacterium]
MASHSGWIDLNVNDARAPGQPKWSNVNESSLPDGNLVSAYWAEKSLALGLNSSDIPEAWAFGGTADQADELLGLVLSGKKTATSSSLWSYQAEEEPLPAVGELSIVCDGQGRPRALLRVTDVTVADFDDVSERHAFAEGEGDRTLASWRPLHEDFFRSQLPAGCELTGSMPVVLESFERLAP